eukprot:GFUD01075431.1.p1 GENE.GFUD01075431.1~~GFUD01075431.1.p1  ORF type:complete len:160 (+),score=38.99 GFUD01075431.1:45-482(+)
MSPTPKTYNWSSNTNQSSASASASGSSGWNVNSSNGWGGGSVREQNSGSASSSNSFFVGPSNNNESLPKFSDTFCSSSGSNSFKSVKSEKSTLNEFSWNGSSSRRNSAETGLFGDPKKKVDWDGLVDNVFKEEIVKLSDSVRNKG